MRYDYDPYNIILIISFVITLHQLVAMLIVRYTSLDLMAQVVRLGDGWQVSGRSRLPRLLAGKMI